MFRCDFCGKIAPPGSRRVLVATERQEVVHPHRSAANRVRNGRYVEAMPDQGGVGLQIKKEKKACPTCAPTVSALAV